MKKTDSILVLTVFVIAITIIVSSNQLRNPLGDTTFNLHDSYFVIPTFQIHLLLISILGFAVFLVKQLATKFQGITGSIILIISASLTLMLIPVFERLYWIFKMLINSGWHTVIIDQDRTLEPTLLIIRIILLATLIYSTYKLGQNRK